MPVSASLPELPERNHDRRRGYSSYIKFSPMGFLMKKTHPLFSLFYSQRASCA